MDARRAVADCLLRRAWGVRTIESVRPRLSLAALLVLLVAPCARAEVVVYFGTVQHFAVNDDPVVQSRKTYVVVDRFQKRVGLMSYGRDVIGKRHDSPEIDNVDFLPFPRGDGQTEDGFAIAVAQGSFSAVGGGGYAGLFLHGLEVPVAISVSGTTENVQPRAKVLTGTNAGAGVSILGGLYRCDIYKVTFNKKLTIEANGANDTVDTAMAHLVGLLEAAGYVSK